MMRIFPMLLTLVFLQSCRSTVLIPANRPISKIELIAKNLSEDGSFLSSKNDELFLFIFKEEEGQIVTVLQEAIVFQKAEEKQVWNFQQLASEQNYIIILVEMDSNSELDAIRLSIENNYLKLMEFYNKHDLGSIKEVLGDDDVLGISRINAAERSVKFEGSQRGDYYHYLINFK